MEDANKPYLNNDKIAKTIRSMRTDSPLRPQAERILADPDSAIIDDLQPVLSAFNRRGLRLRRDRIVALWIISNTNWTTEQKTALAEFLSKRVDKELKRGKSGRGAVRWFGRAMVVSLLGLYVFCCRTRNYYTLAEMVEYWYAWIILAVFVTVVGSIVTLPISMWLDIWRTRNYRPMLDSLGNIGNPACLGTIATALSCRPLQSSAEAAFLKVASRLSADDYGTLPSDTTPALCWGLMSGEGYMTLPILKALLLIGDGRAIATVKHIRRYPRNQETANTAQELLVVLRKREEESTAPTQLLRASSIEERVQEELLRPAVEENNDCSGLLLRASEANRD